MKQIKDYDIMQDRDFDEKYSNGIWDLAGDLLDSELDQETLYNYLQDFKDAVLEDKKRLENEYKLYKKFADDGTIDLVIEPTGRLREINHLKQQLAKQDAKWEKLKEWLIQTLKAKENSPKYYKLNDVIDKIQELESENAI